MPELTENVKKFLEEPNLAHFVTLMKNGSPQITPLWVDHDGTHILINTAEGRQKPLNLRRDPRVAISIVDRESPYRYVIARGKVVDITTRRRLGPHLQAEREVHRQPRVHRQPGRDPDHRQDAARAASEAGDSTKESMLVLGQAAKVLWWHASLPRMRRGFNSPWPLQFSYRF